MQTPQNVLSLPLNLPRFIPPTLEMVKLHASKIGLPPDQAEMFFYHFSSNGWKVGGKAKMQSWTCAMMTWLLRIRCSATSTATNGATTVVMQREYDRVLERLRVLRSQYGEMQTWTDGDTKEKARLIARREELKKKLGVML